MSNNERVATHEQPKGQYALRQSAALAAGFAAVLLMAWQLAIPALSIPQFILPTPLAIWNAFVADWGSLIGSLGVTLYITVVSYLVAVIGGIAIALLLSSSATL